MKKKVSLSVVINIVLILALVIVGAFGYFYYLKVDPTDNLREVLAPVDETVNYEFLFSIYGEKGFTLAKPEGVAYGDSKIWVADTKNSRIVVFDYNGKPLFEFGRKEADEIKLSKPVDILVEQDRVLVLDFGLRNIVAYDLSGNLQGYFGEKMVPMPMDIVRYGEYYAVLDLAGPGVIFLNQQGESIERNLAGYGEADGQLRFPQSLAVDGNKLIVADNNNDRLQVLEDIKGKFKPLKVKDDAGMGIPRALAVKDGRYYVGSSTGRVINVFKSQEPLESIGSINKPDSDGLGIGSPVSVAIDDKGRVYVADVVRSRIMVYGEQP